jgi:hypothetical protein
MLSLGTFPDVSLAKARERRTEARRLVADGIDPSAQRKTDKIAAAIAVDNTFGVVAKDYLKKLEDEGKAPMTIEKNRWLLEDLAAPLTKRPILIFKGVREDRLLFPTNRLTELASRGNPQAFASRASSQATGRNHRQSAS